jgi:Tfp pilus assembly protein FimV
MILIGFLGRICNDTFKRFIFMRNHFSLKLYAFIVSLFFHAWTYAGLGELQVNSRLGEPLKAQILLTDVKNEDLASLKIQLKGDMPLKWKLNSSNGQVFLMIASERAVKALPLRFIVLGFMPTQRLSREYSVSFDGQNPNQVEEVQSATPIVEASEVVLGVNPIKKKAKEGQKETTSDSELSNPSKLDVGVSAKQEEGDWLSQLKDLGAPLLSVLAGFSALLPPLLGDNLLVFLALLGLIGLLFFWRRHTTKNKGNSEQIDRYASTEVTSINLSARNAMEGDNTMLAELTRMVPGQLNAQTAKVDAIMEADVYLSYGRSDHAEAVLKEAIAESPLDTQYHLKLLDMFANEKNVSKFDRYLLGLHKVTSGEGPAWGKAIALGKVAGSNHNLLRSGVEFTMPEDAAITKSKNNFDQLLASTSTVKPVQAHAQSVDFEFDSQMVSLNQSSSVPSSAQVDFFAPKQEEKIIPPASKKDPRIDLARVYLEMGDKAQAKIILLSFLDEAAVKRIFDI